MPVVTNTPKNLKPYLFHGVRLEYREGEAQAVADCPFCGKSGKFSVNIGTGLWRCFVCGEGSEKGGGNIYTFLRLLWNKSDELTNGNIDGLAAERKLADPMTLAHWGVCQSILNGDWILPGFSPDGKLNQLYRYVKDVSTGKKLLLATPELSHQVFGAHQFDYSKPTVYLCEGPWDAMALWETLRSAKPADSANGQHNPPLERTGSEASSLYSRANVIAAPGCNVFNDNFVPLFSGRKVVLLYDSDHPRPHPKTGEPIEPVGWAGMRRVAGILGRAAEPPLEVHYLAWGEGGYDKDKPSGYDVRDLLSEGKSIPERLPLLRNLLGRVRPIPPEWVAGRTKKASASGGLEMECVPCDDWKELVTAWRKAMRWTEGLDRALSVMLACSTSTKAVGDQLWIKVIGPASCGKSTLCEAMSINRKYIYPKDTLTGGLISGYQSDKEGSENMSMVERLRDKTLVINDGDTLLQLPNVTQVLSQLRAFYGRNIRSQYGNQMSTDHEAINCTVIICGTSSLRKLDSSELGERFLDCVIMDRIDEDLEDEILLRVVNRMDANMAFESDGTKETQQDPALVNAMQLTGGFIEYLRSNARELLAGVDTPPEALVKCAKLGKFVAYMRARPSIKQDESAEREFSARLASQLTRLAKCLAVVLNRTVVDDEVMRRVTKTALDTARGRTLDIAKHLYEAGASGLETKAMAILTHHKPEEEQKMLRFLGQIGAAEYFTAQLAAGLQSRPRWRLSNRLRRLYSEIVHGITEEPV